MPGSGIFRRIGAVMSVASLAMASLCTCAAAQSSFVPNAAFFGGVGGGVGSIKFNNQNVYAQGVSNVYLNGAQVAYGQAGGPAPAYTNTQTAAFPAVQIGYFQHFSNSEWLWGGKFLFRYLGATATNDRLVIPQLGSFTSANSASFTGNVVAKSYQTSIHSQLALMPFIGHSFTNGFVYIGGGPTLSETQYKLNDVIGFADINGMHADITGKPSNYSNSQWVFGGALAAGGTYFLSPSWFVDASYTYALTKYHQSSYAGPFASSTDGYVDTGILSGTYSGQVISQSVTVSINKTFF